MRNSIASVGLAYSYRITRHPICCLPLWHVGGWMQIERAWSTGGKVYFYVPHRHVIDFLKENFILYDAICEVSDIRVISYGGKFKRKFIYISTLLYWLFLLVNGAKFIHFGMLDIWPFNFLSFIKSNNIYYMQNDSCCTT